MLFYSRSYSIFGLSAFAVLALAGCGGGGSNTPESSSSGNSSFAAVKYVYANIFGGTLTPSNVAIDGNNNVYLSDSANQQIQEFKADGTPMVHFGSQGSGNGQLGEYGASGIAIDSSGTIYAADEANHRIEKFSAGGDYLSQFDTKDVLPIGVAVDTQGYIYVVGAQYILTNGMFGPTPGLTGTNLVYKFSNDGTFQYQLRVPGQSTSQINLPQDVAIGTGNNVYIIDSQTMQVNVFKSDGTFLNQFNTHERVPFSDTFIGIATDGAGNIYLANSNSHIEKFKSDGTYLTQFDTSVGGNAIHAPTGVAVDASGNIYVCDNRHPVEIFHPVN